jgi:hypothetical protein
MTLQMWALDEPPPVTRMLENCFMPMFEACKRMDKNCPSMTARTSTSGAKDETALPSTSKR